MIWQIWDVLVVVLLGQVDYLLAKTKAENLYNFTEYNSADLKLFTQ